jgi:hypothetical protein
MCRRFNALCCGFLIFLFLLSDFDYFSLFFLFMLIQSYKDSPFANIMRPNSLSIMLEAYVPENRCISTLFSEATHDRPYALPKHWDFCAR